MILRNNSDLLEEVKEALVRCDVLGGLQQRVLLLLGEGGDAPINSNVLLLVCIKILTHGPQRNP